MYLGPKWENNLAPLTDHAVRQENNGRFISTSVE